MNNLQSDSVNTASEGALRRHLPCGRRRHFGLLARILEAFLARRSAHDELVVMRIEVRDCVVFCCLCNFRRDDALVVSKTGPRAAETRWILPRTNEVGAVRPLCHEELETKGCGPVTLVMQALNATTFECCINKPFHFAKS